MEIRENRPIDGGASTFCLRVTISGLTEACRFAVHTTTAAIQRLTALIRGESMPHLISTPTVNFRIDVDLLNHPSGRLALNCLLVAATYYVAAALGFVFRVPPTQSPIICVSNAVLLTVFLVTPPNRWVLWILATAPAHVLAEARDTPVLLLVYPFLADVGQAALAAYGLRHFAKADDPCGLNTFRKMALFILIALIGAPALVSFSAALIFVLAGWEKNYMIAAPARFLSNVVSGFVVVPLLFAVVRGSTEKFQRVPSRTYAEVAVLILALSAALGMISLYSGELKNIPWMLYGPIPFLIWAAVRYGPAGVSLTLLIVAGGALFETMNGRGAFVEGSPVQNLFSLELSLAVLGLPLMLLSSLNEEARGNSSP
jgi:integral membrane sensor domain MASE1